MTLPTQADGGIYIDGAKVNAKPGNVICIKAGKYPYINLQNFNGTAAAPIIFRNCGGQVIVEGKNYGISLSRNKHYKFEGNGASGVKYGFLIDGLPKGQTMSNGLGISNQSSDFTISNVEIKHIGGAGMMCKTNPTCDPMTWGGNFTMKNVDIHDLYIHDVTGEGFYVGITSRTMSITCDGVAKTVPTQTIENLKMYNNITENTGWDGLQVSSVPVNAEIYNNTIKNFGLENHSSQQAGLLFGGMTSGKFYNNKIYNGSGSGIQVLGVGYIQGYNNLIVNTGQDPVAKQDGFYIDDRPVPGLPVLYVSISNNTVVNSGRGGIRLENSKGSIVSNNNFYNNLVVKTGTGNYITVRNNVPNTMKGNKFVDNVAGAGFVNSAANDFHLAAGSVAIDAGVAVSLFNITIDLDGILRLLGLAPDAGAYEYNGGVTAPVANKAPISNAGSDVAITIPTTSATLNGSASRDEDGSINSYSWTKVSGPSAGTITAATSANTTVTGLAQGVYEFELKVTDDKGATATDRVKVTVSAGTSAPGKPVVNAGSDLSVSTTSASL
ncbi:MAG: hypothetical protein EON99_00805, partial [Chitinophagaceae bacterium]